MSILKSFIFLIFLLAPYAGATEIKQTTYAYWDKPDVEIFYITPNKIDKDTQLLFVIHGNSRNAEDYISAWIPYISNKNIIVVAPQFNKNSFRYFFLLESATSSGKINNNPDNYINNSLSSFFNFCQSKFSLSTNKYKMFGHSAGAQFTHRYMLLSNDKRISNAVIANAGWYTFLNESNFPYGIKNSPIDISSDHIKWFMEMYIDSADWVMVPNVYGMGTFADGGIFSTKPYICGSSYMLRMSNYKKGEWCDVVDGLYWRFIENNLNFFKTNPRLSLMVNALTRLDPERKKLILTKAEEFIENNTN